MSESSTRRRGTSAGPEGDVRDVGSMVGAWPTDALYWAMTESLPEISVTVFDRDLRFRMAYGQALS